MSSSHWTRATAVAGAAVALTFTLAGCGVLESLVGVSGDAERDEAGSVQSESDIGIFNLQVGDCKMEDAPGEISDTKVVPCAESHDEEVFFEYAVADGDFPGETAITDEADEKCAAEFAEFVGVAWEDSELDYFGIYPTQQTWEQADDRIVQCVIWDPAGPVTGTLEGAAR